MPEMKLHNKILPTSKLNTLKQHQNYEPFEQTRKILSEGSIGPQVATLTEIKAPTEGLTKLL